MTNCGWITSEGEFIACGYGKHDETAEEKKLNKEDCLKITVIGGEYFFIFPMTVTEKQASILEWWCKENSVNFPSDDVFLRLN